MVNRATKTKRITIMDKIDLNKNTSIWSPRSIIYGRGNGEEDCLMNNGKLRERRVGKLLLSQF